MLEADKQRYKMENGGSMLGDLDNDGKLSGYEQARQDAIEDNMRDQKQEGGPMSMDDQMKAALIIPMEEKEDMSMESEMESDDDMEDNYTRFIMDEALSEEEEDMLMSKLEQDEQLSMLFDK